MIAFQETTESGFGDRLRGVAYALHLAACLGETQILYNDDVAHRNDAWRWQNFPARMPDVIRVEGLELVHHVLPLPVERARCSVIYDSLVDHVHDTRPGFVHLRRLRPRDEAVAERVRALGVDRSWLGFHVRRTDNVRTGARREDAGAVRSSLGRLRCLARRCGTRRVFLAADNAVSLRRWGRILETAGYEVRTNEPAYDAARLRQTSTHDMMVDFFALAACRRVVRGAPSEFSRFAAWVGGRRLRYHELL